MATYAVAFCVLVHPPGHVHVREFLPGVESTAAQLVPFLVYLIGAFLTPFWRSRPIDRLCPRFALTLAFSGAVPRGICLTLVHSLAAVVAGSPQR